MASPKKAQQVNLLLVTHEDPSVSTETHVIKEEINHFHRVVSDLHSVLWHACPHNWHSCMCVCIDTHTIKTNYKNMWLSNLRIFCFSLQNGNQKLILHLLFLLKYPGNESACLLSHYSFYNFVLQVNS